MINYVLLFISIFGAFCLWHYMIVGFIDKYLAIKALVGALILTWPIMTGLQWVGARDDARVAAREKAEVDWRFQMAARSCKLADYISSDDKLYEVWRCADGSAELRRKAK